MPETTEGYTGAERGQIEDLGKLKNSAVGVWIQVKINNGMGVFIYLFNGGEQIFFVLFLRWVADFASFFLFSFFLLSLQC